jgi:monovalent cation:H+ antiporter, CPA1 family
MFLALSIFITLTAIMAWTNERWLKWPTAVGVTLLSALGSFILLLWHQYVSPLNQLVEWTSTWKFNDLLMHGILCFLLFASALHVDVSLLKAERVMIFILSTFGVFLAAIFTATVLWLILPFIGIQWSWMLCLLFGVIVSPTDAVVASDALKRAFLPDRLKAKILGESLFNDGTSVVLFSLVVALLFSQHQPPFFSFIQGYDLSWTQWPAYFIWQVLGGSVIGILIGGVFLYAISTVNQPTVELLLTLSCAMLTYAIADMLLASAPIAVAFAGLAVSQHGRKYAMSEDTQSRVFPFWELLDELLNVGLFVLIGIQLLQAQPSFISWMAALIAIPVALASRYFSVAIPFVTAKYFRDFSPKVITWMTIGGLRGGISLALAMSVPPFEGSSTLLVMTYVVVVFSIVIQGGYILPKLAKKYSPG